MNIYKVYLRNVLKTSISYYMFNTNNYGVFIKSHVLFLINYIKIFHNKKCIDIVQNIIDIYFIKHKIK